MKKTGVCSLILALLLSICLVLPAAALPEQNADNCYTLWAGKPLAGSDKLLPTAKAVMLYELNSGTLVYSWNPDLRVDPSGMNKIMSALVALENSDPNAIVTVKRSVLNTVPIGSVSAGLKSAEEISMKDLLYCMVVGSANDAAAVIADHVGGSQENFVVMMNQRAAELGCVNTYFANPTGMSAAGQYSTARDLAVITEAALQIPAFYDMFTAAQYTVAKTNKSEVREVHTTNYLMSKAQVKDQYDERVTGGKTGALSTTDRSLICTSEYGNCRYLSVVMSASGTVTEDGLAAVTFGSFEETRQLMDFAYGGFDLYTLTQPNQPLTQFQVPGGECPVSVCVDAAVRATLPKDLEQGGLSYRYILEQQLNSTVKKGDTVGRYEAWYQNICVASGPLIAMHTVEAAGSGNQIIATTTGQGNRILMAVLRIGGAVILFGIAIFCCLLLVVRVSVEVQRRKRQETRQTQGSK